MGAVNQRGGKLQTPDTLRIAGGGAEQGGAFIDADLRIRRAAAVDHRTGFVSRDVVTDIPLHAAGVVFDSGDHRNVWCDGINRQGKGPGSRAAVPGGIFCHRGDLVQTIRQRRGWGEAPLPAVAHLGGADLYAIHPNADRRTRFAGAVQGWAVVVGGAIVGDGFCGLRQIVDHLGNGWRGRWRGIKDDAPAVGEFAAVVIAINGLRRQDVATVAA